MVMMQGLVKAYPIFILSWGDILLTVSRLAQGPTQPSIQCLPGAFSLGVKQAGT
jgi:hypothetical protein